MLELLKTLLVRRDAFVREVLLPYGAGLDQKNLLLNLLTDYFMQLLAIKP